MDSKNNDEKIVLLPVVQGFTSNLHWTTRKALGKMLEGDTRAAALSYAFIDNDTDNEGNPVNVFDKVKLEAFEAGAKWQAIHSLETIKGMEEQAFLAGVEAEQINKSFSKEELLNGWRINYEIK